MRVYKDQFIKGNSVNWKNWQAIFDEKVCDECYDIHGTIYPPDEIIKRLHLFDRCNLVPMRTKKNGTATKYGVSGVDSYLKKVGVLPPNYISKKEADSKGWIKKKGNLADVLPGKIIGGDVYHNSNFRLPKQEGRIWYEADLEYESGYRSTDRIVYSSDGLVFLTFDHYETFYEVI